MHKYYSYYLGHLKKMLQFFWVAQLLLSHLTNQKSTNFISKKTHGQNGYVQHDLTKVISWLGWILSLLCGFWLVFLTKYVVNPYNDGIGKN